MTEKTPVNPITFSSFSQMSTAVFDKIFHPGDFQYPPSGLVVVSGTTASEKIQSLGISFTVIWRSTYRIGTRGLSRRETNTMMVRDGHTS